MHVTQSIVSNMLNVGVIRIELDVQMYFIFFPEILQDRDVNSQQE